MENNKFIYDAFISYRHTDLDRFVAENLHKQMESFKPPKSVAKNDEDVRKKINRVFRDKDELPLASNLEDPIIEALKNSEYLVVICSPRLKESMWCKKEIQTFIELHGRRKILAVLIEGEPEDSFPDELLYDGDKLVEPLAADFRGRDKKEMKKAMKSEILRLLAPMFNVSYDDLRQRHREKKIRSAIMLASIIAAVGICFGLVSTYAALKINSQKNEILAQKDEIEAQKDKIELQKNQIEDQTKQLAIEQAVLISDNAKELLKNDNRVEAVKLAYESMTTYQGVEMPQTAEAERVLASCVNAYEGGGTIGSGYQIESSSIISNIKVSPNGKYILSYDDSKSLFLWDMDEQKKIYSVLEAGYGDKFDFINEDNFMYMSLDGDFYKVNISTLKETKYELENDIFAIYLYDAVATHDGTKVVLQTSDSIDILDAVSFKKINSFEYTPGVLSNCLYLSQDSKTVISSYEGEAGVVVTGFDLSDGKIYEKTLPLEHITDACVADGTLYIIDLVSDDFISGKTELIALNVNTGEIEYQKNYDREMFSEIYYSNGTGGAHLLLKSFYQSIMLEAQNGERIDSYYSDNKVAMVRENNDGGFLLYLSDGNCNVISGEYPYSSLGLKAIECNNVKKFVLSEGYLYGIHEDDNRIVRYARFYNSDAELYDGELAEPLAVSILASEAKEYIAGKNLDEELFVNSVLELKDANLLIAGCVDNRMLIYRLDTLEKLSEYGDCPINDAGYYGKINDYYVVQGTHKSYMINDDGKVCADTANAAGVSENYDGLILYGKDEAGNSVLYKVPVYTKEMLLKKAEHFMKNVGGGK